MRTIVTNGTLVTPLETLTGRDVVVEDGIITDLPASRPARRAGPGEHIVDAAGLWVGPGLIDLHVHGGRGSDTMDASPDALHIMAAFFAARGVTSFLATTVTAPVAATRAAVENAAAAPQAENGARFLGVHLEGPVISAGMRGAQPVESIRPPDPGETADWLRYGGSVVRLISLAPEVPGVLDFIAAGRERGIYFSAGHTSATYDQVIAAADRGLTHATHTFNGMTGLHHREPGAAGAILTDERIFAEIIVDGVHLHPAVVALVVRAKGIDRTILVTDSIRAVGLEDGVYDLGGHPVQVSGGVARTSEGGLAGSTLTLDRAVRNTMKFTGLSLNHALAMATRTPALSMGWENERGSLKTGQAGDAVLFDANFAIRATLVGGRVVYDARSA